MGWKDLLNLEEGESIVDCWKVLIKRNGNLIRNKQNDFCTSSYMFLTNRRLACCGSFSILPKDEFLFSIPFELIKEVTSRQEGRFIKSRYVTIGTAEEEFEFNIFGYHDPRGIKDLWKGEEWKGGSEKRKTPLKEEMEEENIEGRKEAVKKTAFWGVSAMIEMLTGYSIKDVHSDIKQIRANVKSIREQRSYDKDPITFFKQSLAEQMYNRKQELDAK